MIVCVDTNSAASTATYIGASRSMQGVAIYGPPIDVPPSLVQQLDDLNVRGNAYTWVFVSSSKDTADNRLMNAVESAVGNAGERARLSYPTAIRLLNLLSDEPMPEVTVEDTGEVSFEWYKDRHHVAVLSVDAGGNLRWAAMAGPGNPMSGAQVLVHEIPAEALAAIHAAI